MRLIQFKRHIMTYNLKKNNKNINYIEKFLITRKGRGYK
jgi:hypothetical protein